MNAAFSVRTVLALSVAVALSAAAPLVADTFALLQITGFVCMTLLALSLAFIWGYGGILSFGQAAFFGIGGYTYAVAAINLGDSTVPILLSIAVPALAAALLGYFMFYGRVSDVYVGVITLTVTLILYNAMNSTAGDQYAIGTAVLGGFNGMPAVPPINMPFRPDRPLSIEESWYLTAGSLILLYVILRAALASHFGRVVVAIRENETRAALLGYDPRLFKLLTFVIGGAIAGLAGCLYTSWGAFVSPTIFGLANSAQIIIWVTVGGLGTLIGPIVGCLALQFLTNQLGGQQALNVNLVLGAVLLAFVLLMPSGLVGAGRFVREKLRVRPVNRMAGGRMAPRSL